MPPCSDETKVELIRRYQSGATVKELVREYSRTAVYYALGDQLAAERRARETRVVELARLDPNMGVTRLAKTVGVHRSVVWRLLGKHRQLPKFAASAQAEARRRAVEGQSVRAIGTALGVSHSTVWRWLRKKSVDNE